MKQKSELQPGQLDAPVAPLCDTRESYRAYPPLGWPPLRIPALEFFGAVFESVFFNITVCMRPEPVSPVDAQQQKKYINHFIFQRISLWHYIPQEVSKSPLM